MQNSLEEQTQYYDKLFEEYQSSLEAEQARYDESLKVIKETQILDFPITNKKQTEILLRIKNFMNLNFNECKV